MVEPAAIGDNDRHKDFIRPRRVGDRHRDRVEMRKRPGIILVAERHVEDRAGRRDRSHSTRSLPSRRRSQHASAFPASGERTRRHAPSRPEPRRWHPSAGDRRSAEQFDQSGHQPLTEFRPGLVERPQILDELAGKRVADHRKVRSPEPPASPPRHRVRRRSPRVLSRSCGFRASSPPLPSEVNRVNRRPSQSSRRPAPGGCRPRFP